jgi:cysteine protease ATG4
MAVVIQRLLGGFGISVLVPENGFISKPGLVKELSKGRPVLVLLPLMVGPSTLGKDYVGFVKIAVSLKEQSVGIIGGQQGKAFFVVGVQNEEFLYFDPHIVTSPVSSQADTERLFHPPLKRMKAGGLNSSMLVGLFVTSVGDVEEIAKLAEPLTTCPFAVDEQVGRPPAVVADDEGWDVVTVDTY